MSRVIVAMVLFTAALVAAYVQASCIELSECVQSASLREYLVSRGIVDIGLTGWPGRFTAEINPSLSVTCEGVKIMRTTMLAGGGDYSTFAFLEKGNNYCALNEKNLQKLFAPIKNKEDALKYYLFRVRDIGGAITAQRIYIFEPKDYDEITGCQDNYQEELHNKVSSIADSDDGYILDLVYFQAVPGNDFYQEKVYIGKDASLSTRGQKIIFDCPGEVVF